MKIIVSKVGVEKAEQIYRLQIQSFKGLLEKYQDYDYSPGAEKLERTLQRFQEPFTDFYFILLENQPIGAMRVCNFESLCKLKQIFILPEYQGNQYAQQAIRLVEKQYPQAKRWEVDTIGQEKKLCHLYEKMGYKKTGKVQPIKEGMDIVFFAKEQVL